MRDEPNIAAAAALIGDPARALPSAELAGHSRDLSK
jgi:hypothetical protein